jgi:hypothetical protein
MSKSPKSSKPTGIKVKTNLKGGRITANHNAALRRA